MQRYVAKLLWQFRFIQIKYRRPDVWTAMADKTESELDAVEQAVMTLTIMNYQCYSGLVN